MACPTNSKPHNYAGWRIGLGSVLLVFEKEKEGTSRLSCSDAYLRLRFSRYTDAANAEKATTATPLNSGTGIWFCSR